MVPVPIVSRRQAKFLFANHPRIAKRMADAMKKSRGKHPLRGLPAKAPKRRR